MPTHVCIYACPCVCTYVCIYVCIHVCNHICIYVCNHVFSYVCTHVCIYVCSYVHGYSCLLIPWHVSRWLLSLIVTRRYACKKRKSLLIMLFWPILCHFCYPVATLVTCSSNLRNFKWIQKVHKSPKKIQRNSTNLKKRIWKNLKNLIKST